MSEIIQKKLHEHAKTATSPPDSLQLVPETTPDAAQESTVHRQANPASLSASEPSQFVSGGMSRPVRRAPTSEQLKAEINKDLYDDYAEKTDIFALALNIAVVILILVYVTIFALEGTINRAMISLPFIALVYVWFSNGRIGLVSVSSRQLNTLVLFPVSAALFLTIEISDHAHILDYSSFWFPCIFASAMMGELYYYVGTRNQDITGREKLLIPACAIAYVYGAVMFVNISFDTSKPIFHQVPILAEHRESSYSSHGGNNYE